MPFLHRRLSLLLLAALALSGCSDSDSPGIDPLAPEATVRRFADCAELSSYLYAAQDTEELLRQRFGSGDSLNLPVAGEPLTTGDATVQEKTWTGTNNQEAGVDEADFVKNDGDYLYVLGGGHLVISAAWPAETLREVSRTAIAGSPVGLLVYQDTLAVFSALWNGPVLALDGFAPSYAGLLKLTLLDVADRSAPRLLRELYLEGAFQDARLLAGRLHLVLSTPVALAQPRPLADGVSGTGAAANQSLPPADFPRSFDRRYPAGGDDPVTEALCACDNVLRPTVANGNGLLTLVTLDLAEPEGATERVSILGFGGTVYASPDSLIVASTDYGPWLWRPVQLGESSEPQQRTLLHRFSLGAAPAYQGSGTVPGRIVNAFALSEYEGVLRIATTEDNWWSAAPPANRLFLLAPEGAGFRELGRLDELGKPGESIQAVRYLGASAFVVTFQRTDPLYALDLSDPAAPLKAGQLEVPGLSTYLHPVGASHLLGVGRDGQNLKLSLYDVADMSAPRQVGTDYTIGLGSSSEAEYDHKAFTYFAEERVLALPMTVWNAPLADSAAFPGYFNGLQLFDVDPDLGFSLRGTIDHAGFFQKDGEWYWPLQVRRSFFISEAAAGSYLYSVSGGGIRVHDVADLQRPLPEVPLPFASPYWYEGPVAIGTVTPAGFR